MMDTTIEYRDVTIYTVTCTTDELGGRMTQDSLLNEWLADRPAQIQHLARAYPPGITVQLPGHPLRYVLGYHETAGAEAALILTEIDPAENYEAAVNSERFIAHPSCIKRRIESGAMLKGGSS